MEIRNKKVYRIFLKINELETEQLLRSDQALVE